MIKTLQHTTAEFHTIKSMESEKKEMMNKIIEFAGVPRENFRLQQGMLTLQGLTKYGQWINITSRIGDFKTYIKNGNYTSYKLHTTVQKKE